MDHNPEAYQQMLQLVRMGAYAHSAAAAMGVTPRTFSEWIKRGREEDEDGVYRQFFLDVMRAIGEARTESEIALRNQDHKAYLKCGAARMLGDEWREEPTSVQLEMKGKVSHEHRQVQCPTDEATLVDALIELRNAGVIEFTESMIVDAPASERLRHR